MSWTGLIKGEFSKQCLLTTASPHNNNITLKLTVMAFLLTDFFSFASDESSNFMEVQF